MTQEEKAKAYDEALERARKLYNDAKANEYISDMEDYEYIFPELAESEDDRIRRWLCDYFSSIDKAWIHKDITCIDILRWLEKQKEQMPEWSKNDTVFLNEITDFFENKTVRLQHDIDMYAHWLKSLPERFSLQPKQEWSEEDTEMYINVASSLHGYACGLENEEHKKYIKKGLDWLENRFKSLLSQSHWKPSEVCYGAKGHPDPAGTSDLEEAAKEYASKTLCDPDDGPSTGLAKESFIAGAEWQKEPKPAEWSEEDEKDMAHIIRILNDCYVYAKHDLSKTDHENLVNKLKSLRPSWKPSKEQMKALYDACCIAFEEERDFHPSLSRLYHDLRKL